MDRYLAFESVSPHKLSYPILVEGLGGEEGIPLSKLDFKFVVVAPLKYGMGAQIVRKGYSVIVE